MNWPFKPAISKKAQVECKHRKIDDMQVADDVAEVMKTPAGRRLFMRIIIGGGVYRKTKPDDSILYAAGRRDAALEVMAAVNRHAVADAMLALQESNAEMDRRNRELQAAQIEDHKKKDG